MRLRSLFCLLSLACVAGNSWAADPLDYVPADTPYLIANEQPASTVQLQVMQLEISGMSRRNLLQAMKTWRDGLATALARIGEPATEASQTKTADPDSDVQAESVNEVATTHAQASIKQLLAVTDQLILEIESLRADQDVSTLGLKPNGLAAFYGLGLLPTLRIEMSDAARFKALIGRLEKAAQSKLEQWGDTKDPLWALRMGGAAAVIALHDGHVVLGLLPADATAEERALLLARPDAAMGRGGLQRFNRKQGLLAIGSGFIDMTSLMKRLLSPPGPLERALADDLGVHWPTFSAACAKEWAALANVAPRFAAGFTRLDKRGIDLRGHWDLRPDLARELMEITASAPPLDSQSKLVALTVAADPQKALAFMKRRTVAVAEDPFTCEQLLELNSRFAEMDRSLTNMPSALLLGLRGVAVSLDALAMEPDSLSPTRLDISAAAHSAQPAMLLGWLQLAWPQVAQAGLEADGKAVTALDVGLPPMLGPIALVHTDTLLAGATGPDGGKRLEQLATTAIATSTPLLSMRFTGAAYALIAKYAPLVQQMDGSDAGEIADLARSSAAIAKELDSVDVRISLTSRGVEFYQSSVLAQ